MRKIALAVGSTVIVLGLLLGSCAPAATPPPRPAATAPAPAAVATIAPSPATGTTPAQAPAPTPTLAPAPKPSPTAAPASAAEKPRYGGILTLSHRSDPAHFDMHQEKTYLIQNPLAPVYSQLVQHDPRDNKTIIGDLAERWEVSPDGKTYTFYLRKGMKFHDGAPLTSADVKASFERQIWPPKGILSPRQAGFASVEKIEAPDDSTVRFLLKFPQASLLEMTAMPFTWVFPKRILDAKGDMKKDVMGSGPFKLKEYIRGISFELVKNPDYFIKDRPYLDGITRYIIRDIGAIHAAFKSGRVQQLVGIQGELYGPELAKLQQDMPNVVVQKAAETTKPYLFPNHTRKPWSDVRVRKAIDLAIDRQAGIQVVFKGDATVGSYFMPGSGWEIPTEELLKMPGYRQPKDQDIAEAKRLLAEAGYPNGFKTTIVTRIDLKFTVDEAVFFKDQLRKIDIDADVKIMEVGVFYAIQSAADFDLDAHAFTVATPEPDVLIAEQYTTNSGANWGRYLNPKIDEIFFKQMKTVDPAERRKLLREMQEILINDRMRVVLAWRRGSTVAWPQVKGYVMGPNFYYGMKYQDVWLSQ